MRKPRFKKNQRFGKPLRKPTGPTRRALLGLLPSVAMLVCAAHPAEAWMRRGEFTANYHFMYVFTGYADEAAAKADLSEFVSGGNWVPEAISGITVTGESGFSVAVKSIAVRDDLYSDNTNCRIEFNLWAKNCNRSKITYRALLSTTIDGVLPEEIYHDWHPTGLMPPRTLGEPNAWCYQQITGTENLHWNQDGLVANFAEQCGRFAMAVNGAGGTLGGGPGSGGGSYSIPNYIRESSTPLVDVTPTNNDPHPYYAGSAGVYFQDVICNDVGIPVGTTAAGGTDMQCGFGDFFNDTWREFWIFRLSPYRANRGGLIESVSTNNLRYPTTWGVAATALPMMCHQLTIDEYVHQGVEYAQHALGYAVIDAQAVVAPWPASRSDGVTNTRTTPNVPPEGIRWFWDTTFDVDATSWHPLVKFIVKTWQHFPACSTDRAGSVGPASVENEKPFILQGIPQKWPGLWSNTVAFYQLFNGVNGPDADDFLANVKFLPNEWGRPSFRPPHSKNCAHWFSCANVGDLITQSGADFQPMTGAYDISSNSVELGTPSSLLAPDYWSAGWPNKSLPSARFNAANDERLITNQAKRLMLGAGCNMMAIAGAASSRTGWIANSRIMSLRANGQTNDDDNDGSQYFGVNAAATHLVWRNNGTELIVAALPAVGTDFVWAVVCDGSFATPFYGVAGGGWNAGTPIACTSVFGDANGQCDIAYGNIYQGGAGFTGAIPFGAVWAQSADLLTDPIDNYLDTWVTT